MDRWTDGMCVMQAVTVSGIDIQGAYAHLDWKMHTFLVLVF